MSSTDGEDPPWLTLELLPLARKVPGSFLKTESEEEAV